MKVPAFSSLHPEAGKNRLSSVVVEPSDASRKCHLAVQCLKASLTPASDPQYRGDAKACGISMD